MSTAVDQGTQNIFFQYQDPLTGAEFNERNKYIIPIGVYNGGFLTKVNNTTVSVGPWFVVIGDGTYQISGKSTVAYEVSGVSATNRNIVLRWTYATQNNWYVGHYAVADGSVQANDVILGRAVFGGSTLTSFDYTTRTVPLAMHRHLKVIPTPTASMKVIVVGGWTVVDTARIFVATQETSTITAPSTNPRIDLIYIDSNGSIQISTGTEAASPSAPSYQDKMVLAELYLTVGMTQIVESSITDSRVFISPPVSTTNLCFTGMGPIPTLRTTAPSGWLLMDGSTIGNVGSGATYESADYEDLFDIIKQCYPNTGSEVFGSGNKVTIPDMRGRVPIGKDNMGGTSANVVTNSYADTLGRGLGEENHLLSTSELPSHAHGGITTDGNVSRQDNTARRFYNSNYSENTIPFGSTGTAGGGQVHNNMQPSLTVNYLIKI